MYHCQKIASPSVVKPTWEDLARYRDDQSWCIVFSASFFVLRVHPSLCDLKCLVWEGFFLCVLLLLVVSACFSSSIFPVRQHACRCLFVFCFLSHRAKRRRPEALCCKEVSNIMKLYAKISFLKHFPWAGCQVLVFQFEKRGDKIAGLWYIFLLTIFLRDNQSKGKKKSVLFMF